MVGRGTIYFLYEENYPIYSIFDNNCFTILSIKCPYVYINVDLMKWI